jgi:aspartate aminotransferase
LVDSLPSLPIGGLTIAGFAFFKCGNPKAMSDVLDLTHAFEEPRHAHRVSARTSQVQGSQILQIAGEIGQLQAEGKTVCNLSVGDYSPKEFPVPSDLIAENIKAFEEGHTNYPPAIGLPEMRDAVSNYYAHFLGLKYPRESVIITSGARPVVFAFFNAVLNPGDQVINPTPSWNTHYYTALCDAQEIRIDSKAENGFLPTREGLEDSVSKARILCLCSPGNPTGTLFDEEQLAAICDLVLEENARRKPEDGPLYVMYDQVYWPITHGGRKHITPVNLRPEMAKYTVFVDGISKAFAATGVRVGWGLGPSDVVKGMSRYTSHSGSWAPKPAQIATLRYLSDTDKVEKAFNDLQVALEKRLNRLSTGLQKIIDEGAPLRFVPPEGALYLTLEVKIVGRKTPNGKVLENNEDIRQYLLHNAGMGIVPFEAFGVMKALGWFRLSVGAVSNEDIDSLMPRLHEAIEKLQ